MSAALVAFMGTSFAQNKVNPSSDVKTELTSASFLNDVKAFDKATTQQEQEQSVERILNSMRRGIESSKAAIANAKASGNTTEEDKALKVHQSRADLYNEVVKLMRNDTRTKEETMTIFKRYSETL